MSRILICESHEAVLQLLERMVTRLGHEPVAVRMPSPEDLHSVDVVVLEPAAPVGAALAQAVSVVHPSLPLVSSSVAGPSPELTERGVTFVASLIKPFTLEQLGEAIEAALRAKTDYETHMNSHAA